MDLLSYWKRASNFMGPATHASTSRDEKIVLLTTIIVIGFVVTCLYHYYQGLVLQKPYPYNTFLNAPSSGDFYGNYNQWREFQFKGFGYGLSYFPSSYLVINLFAKIESARLALYVFMSIFSLFAIWYTYINLRTEHIAKSTRDTIICTFMSYPFLFEVATANFEAVIFICLCLFVALYKRGWYMASVVPLALGISAKLYPGVFVILFIADKKYKELGYLAVWIFVLSLIPLLIFDGGILSGYTQYLENLRKSLKMYTDLMVDTKAGLHYGHSLFMAIRFWYTESIQSMHGLYILFAAVTFSLASAYVVFIEKILWKRVAVLVICMCLLPFTSTDYKLMHFVIPLYLLINWESSAAESRWDKVFVILLSLLMVPKTFYYINNDPLTSLGTLANPVIMIAVLSMIVGLNIRTITAWLAELPYSFRPHKSRPN